MESEKDTGKVVDGEHAARLPSRLDDVADSGPAGGLPSQTGLTRADLVTQVRSILDSIGQESAEMIAHRLQLVQIYKAEELELVARVILSNVLAMFGNDTYALYADMIVAMCNQYPEFPPESEGSRPCTFLRVLFNVCQDEFENLHASLLPVDQKREEYSTESMWITLHSAMLDSGDWELTCTTMGGNNLLPGLVMPKDYCYEDARVILAKAKSIPSFRVKLVSPTGDLLTKDQEDRLLALMKFLGNLFLKRVLPMQVVGQILCDLIRRGVGEADPTALEIRSACTLCEVIGSCMDSTRFGRRLMSLVFPRLRDLKGSVDPSGKLRLPDELQISIQELLDLRQRNWL